MNLIKLKFWDKLLYYDQLIKEKNENKTFYGFHEGLLFIMFLGLIFMIFKKGKITFQPTYRYDKKTDNWSTKVIFLIIFIFIKKFNSRK